MEGLEGTCCVRAGSALSCVIALIAIEDTATVCGRTMTGAGVLFKFFTWGTAGPSKLDALAFVRDPEICGDDLGCRGTFVEATGFCGVCDFTGREFAGAGSCPGRSGRTAGTTLRRKSSNSERHDGIDSKERTDFLSFFGTCGGLAVDVLGVGSVRGFVGFGAGSAGRLVGVGAVFCGAG